MRRLSVKCVNGFKDVRWMSSCENLVLDKKECSQIRLVKLDLKASLANIERDIWRMQPRRKDATHLDVHEAQWPLANS